MLEESAASAIQQSSLWASMNSWFTPTILFLFLNLMIGTIVFTSTHKHQQNNNTNIANQPPNNPNITNQPHNNTSIARSPSSVLQRLKSINFYSHYTSHQEPQNSSLVRRRPDSDTAFFNVDNALPHYFDHENPLFEQAHYVFEQSHEDHAHETQQDYVFEQTHEDNAHKTQQNYVFEQPLQENHQKTEAHFVSDDQDSTESTMDEVYSQVTGHFRTMSDTEPAGGEVPARLAARMRKSASMKSAFGHFEEEEVAVEARRPATVREKGSAEEDEEVDAKADDFINRFKHQLKLQRLDSIIRYKDVIGRAANVGR